MHIVMGGGTVGRSGGSRIASEMAWVRLGLAGDGRTVPRPGPGGAPPPTLSTQNVPGQVVLRSATRVAGGHLGLNVTGSQAVIEYCVHSGSPCLAREGRRS